MPIKDVLNNQQLFKKAKILSRENYNLNSLDNQIIDILSYGNHDCYDAYIRPFIYYGFCPSLENKKNYFTHIGSFGKYAEMEQLIELSNQKNFELAMLLKVNRLNNKHKLIILFNLFNNFYLDLSKASEVLECNILTLQNHYINLEIRKIIRSIKIRNKILYKISH